MLRILIVVFLSLIPLIINTGHAQMSGVPTLQVCTSSGLVETRSEVTVKPPVFQYTTDSPLTFKIKPMNILCNDDRIPEGDFGGTIQYAGQPEVSFVAESIEQFSVAHRKYQPTAFASGYCVMPMAEPGKDRCRFWVMYVDNRESDHKDSVTLMIHDKNGALLHHATGLVEEGDIHVVM